MNTQVYGPLELPSGKKISFRQDRGIDRANVIQQQKIKADEFATAALVTESLIAVKCIVEENGVAVNGNYRQMYNDMDGSDLDYYMMVRNKMFGMTEDRRAQADDAASFLLGKQTSTDSSSSQNTDTSAATTNG
jgi:hypothetical protein